ncbi:MAG: RlpA-like double-psi beta-barrel domain-containing protein [Chloroflexota bacterium]|nr:RlpA-like double-psi beta-barrel domain-containing protein [Chloroflexota bacterium]
MPDLLRRVAVRTVVFAAGMAVIVPLSVRSATPVPPETQRLLAAAGGSVSTLDRGLVGREASALLSLQEVAPPIGVEDLQSSSLPASAGATPKVSFGSVARPRTPVQMVSVPTDGAVVSGRATWYCCTMGWRGEAVVALPGPLGGHYDAPPAARYVTICADRCARLPVVDYCDCYWGTDSQKVADLSPEAWAAISDANRSVVGVVSVTVHFSG